MRQQYKALNAGNVFTVYLKERHIYALKTDDGRAVNLHTGELFSVFPTKKVDAPDIIDQTFSTAEYQGKHVYAKKLTSGKDDRYVVKSYLVTGSEVVFKHDLTFKKPAAAQSGTQGGQGPE